MYLLSSHDALTIIPLPNAGHGIITFVEWGKYGTFPVEIEIEDKDNSVIRENYIEIRRNWSEFIPEALHRIELMRKDYGYDHLPINCNQSFFSLTIPSKPFTESPEWTFGLNERWGWVLDYRGWNFIGGQGVF